jgi:hypothetical protein
VLIIKYRYNDFNRSKFHKELAMSAWESKIEESIRKALEEANKLPGAGKPLKLEDDPNVPDDMRAAYRMMKDNNIQPEWMLLGRELDEQRDDLLSTLRRVVRAYQGEMGDARRAADDDRSFRAEAVQTYNKRIVTYNLKVPSGVAHRPYLDLQREIQKLLA